MRIISKKIIIAFLVLVIPYIYLISICTIRTDKEAILTGGLTNVNSFVDIDSNFEEKGSFSSIYVTTFYPTTIFQNYILESSTINTSVDNSSSSHLSNEEMNDMNVLSHDTSVMYSLINAYSVASEDDSNIHLDYTFKGINIYYYKQGLDFKVNDKIIEINGVSYEDEKEYKEQFSSQDVGTIFKVIRNNKEIEITLTTDYFASPGYIYYQYYSMYDINYNTSYPSLNVSSSGTGGPSGGLLQTLSTINKITEFDYSLGLKISGTGTINLAGKVGEIGGVEQKIYTAYKNKVDIFFCPKGNYEDAYNTWLKLKHKERMKLVMVETLDDAMSYLRDYE